MEFWILGGVFCNFRFGLREKVGSLDSGGVFCNFRFGLREKVRSLGGEGGGYSATSVLDLGKKLEVWIPGGGVFCNFRFGLREKVGSLDSGGGILQLRFWT